MGDIVEGKVLPPPVDPAHLPQDPPAFLLVASPTWAPWLPDGVWQRVPIGAAGQVLTVDPGGNFPQWANSASGFANPMSATGDLISSNPGSTPVRIPIGSAGQVLTVSGGVPTWTPNSAVGFANPMTTSQDMIVGGASPPGVAGRLGVGANGQVLTVTGGLVGWANSAAGFANPMTTVGDIIIEDTGPAPNRLGIGAANQVLTVVSGKPAWANSQSGFANPMTALGDMIASGSITGTPVRLPVGAAGQVLTVVSGQPAWASGQSAASAVVFPSGDTTGVTDQANITSAYPAHGGEVLLANGAFYVKPTSGNRCLSPPQQTYVAPQGSNLQGSPVCIRGLGQATIIYPVGAGVTGIYMHRSSSYGGQFGNPAQPQAGYLRDFVIDGSLATGASIGLDYGDGWGYEFDLAVVNFAGSGAIGVQQINRVFWTEKSRLIQFGLSNNTTAFYITTNLAPGGDHSSEYNHYDITMFCNLNQNGVVIDGVNMGGSHMWIRGNMQLTSAASGAPTGNVAALSIINASGVTGTDGKRFYEGTFWIKVEANPGSGGNAVYPYLMYSDGVGYVRLCAGAIYDSQLTASNWNGAEFSFNGPIADPNLAIAWPSTAFPGLGVAWNNKGPNAAVAVAGGTVTSILLNGQSLGAGITSGVFPVQAGGSITVNGSVAPTTWTVVPAALPNGYGGSF